MPVYQSVVIEADGKSNSGENAKTLYITPMNKTKSDRRGRFGTFAKILLGSVFILAFLFLMASLSQYLYETFGPKPDKSQETYDSIQQFEADTRSDFVRFLSSKLALQFIAFVLLVIIGKLFWGQDLKKKWLAL
uniref:Type VI secretion protein n=1 Tax=Caenorhabditis tropicalis TaxID=1561998 RepID=A0A1I7ULI7_9PELO